MLFFSKLIFQKRMEETLTLKKKAWDEAEAVAVEVAMLWSTETEPPRSEKSG